MAEHPAGLNPQGALPSDQGSEVGCPIRISTDQSLFAAPHGFSQRTTSFIACACQGIHQMPLRHLIVLIAHDHQVGPKGRPRETITNAHFSKAMLTPAPRATGTGVLQHGSSQHTVPWQNGGRQKDQLPETNPKGGGQAHPSLRRHR